MRDGRTREQKEAEREKPVQGLGARCTATLVVLTGNQQGTDYVLDAASTVLGRGPGVDIEFDDETMSREHACVEFGDEGLRVRDLGSLNGIRINGRTTNSGELAHGDRLELGELTLQLLLEERKREPRTYVVEDD